MFKTVSKHTKYDDEQLNSENLHNKCITEKQTEENTYHKIKLLENVQ